MKRYIIALFFLLSLFTYSCAKEINIKTFEKFKEEYNNDGLSPIGDYFWDDFQNEEQYYNLSQIENKILGKWINMSIIDGEKYNSYFFFPNKLFILDFLFMNFQSKKEENIYFNKAFGTWEIVNDIVQITIYSIMKEDDTKDYRNNKEILLIDKPYTINFINIKNINEEGFTKKSINDTILSDELQRMVKIKKPNKTNNLYARKIYAYSPLDTDSITGGLLKLYGYFDNFPEMAKNGHSGLEIATNPELIKKYIPDWMH